MVSNDAKKYCREVAYWLPCSGKLKKRILEELRISVVEFISDYPNVSYGDIVSRFGMPKEIAYAYVEEQNSDELLHRLAWRHKITKIACMMAALLVLVWVFVVGVSMIIFADGESGDLHTYIEVVEENVSREDENK